METRVVVFHRGALAHYTVSPEEPQTYRAYLMRYDGKPEHAPQCVLAFSEVDLQSAAPENYNLVRSILQVVRQKQTVFQTAG